MMYNSTPKAILCKKQSRTPACAPLHLRSFSYMLADVCGHVLRALVAHVLLQELVIELASQAVESILQPTQLAR